MRKCTSTRGSSRAASPTTFRRSARRPSRSSPRGNTCGADSPVRRKACAELISRPTAPKTVRRRRRARSSARGFAKLSGWPGQHLGRPSRVTIFDVLKDAGFARLEIGLLAEIDSEVVEVLVGAFLDIFPAADTRRGTRACAPEQRALVDFPVAREHG